MWDLSAKAKRPIPLERAEGIARRIEREIRPLVDFSQVVGSVRRKVPQVGDIELVVLPKDLDEFLEYTAGRGFSGGESIQRGTVEGIPFEFYIAGAPEEIGAMVFAWTGDKLFEIAMRSKAKRWGLRLDQRAIWQGGTDEIIFQSPYEEHFFEFLDVRYHSPEERNFGER